MCYEEGDLQEYLDGEMSEARSRELARHLQECSDCRQRLEKIRRIDEFVTGRMQEYLETQGTRTAPARGSKTRARIPAFAGRYRGMVAAAAVVFACGIALSFPGVRSMASDFLTVFRMEQVQTISIKPGDLNQLQRAMEEGAGQADIENFGDFQVVGNSEPVPATLAEAEEAVDFPLRLPAGIDENSLELKTMGGSSVNLTLEVENVNKMLEALGSGTLLPRSLDGETFSLMLRPAVTAKYIYRSKEVMICETRGPELQAPSNVDVEQIRDALLAIPAMPKSIRDQLLAVRDWQHTVLIPNVGGSSEDVLVNGVQGVYISGQKTSGVAAEMSAGGTMEVKDLDAAGASTSSLIWEEDGVVYGIAGDGLSKDTALEIAGQMQ